MTEYQDKVLSLTDEKTGKDTKRHEITRKRLGTDISATIDLADDLPRSRLIRIFSHCLFGCLLVSFLFSCLFASFRVFSHFSMTD